MGGLCGNGTVLHPDCGSGYINIYTWLNCTELSVCVCTHTQVHVKLMKS